MFFCALSHALSFGDLNRREGSEVAYSRLGNYDKFNVAVSHASASLLFVNALN